MKSLFVVQPPRLHHAVALLINAASWLSLLAMIVLDALGWWSGPSGNTGDWMFGIPALFRLFSWMLFGIRGTLAAWGAAIVEVALLGAILTDVSGDTKGQLLISALLMSNVVPAWWALTGRRLGALFGVFGGLLAASVWVALKLDMNEDLFLPVLGLSIVLSWLALAAIAWWGLQEWREARGLNDGRSLD